MQSAFLFLISSNCNSDHIQSIDLTKLDLAIQVLLDMPINENKESDFLTTSCDDDDLGISSPNGKERDKSNKKSLTLRK